MAQRRKGTMAQRHNGAMAQWLRRIKVHQPINRQYIVNGIHIKRET
jgi:hypothetical protein